MTLTFLVYGHWVLYTLSSLSGKLSIFVEKQSVSHLPSYVLSFLRLGPGRLWNGIRFSKNKVLQFNKSYGEFSLRTSLAYTR